MSKLKVSVNGILLLPPGARCLTSVPGMDEAYKIKLALTSSSTELPLKFEEATT